jgi:hypothetical protein
MTYSYTPLVSDENHIVTKNTSEAAAYAINQIHPIDITWDDITDSAYFIFKRTNLLEETSDHYFEGRLRGDLYAYEQQRRAFIEKIRHLQRK